MVRMGLGGIAPLEAHVFLNHVPLVGLVFGPVFLVAGLKRSSDALLRASLRIFVAMGVIVVIVAGSGLVSANILADATWLDADGLSRYRLAGIFTLAILVTLGLSGAMLSSSRNTSTLPAWGRTAVLVLALVAFGACFWTAHVGGRLRHSELRRTRSSLNSPVSTA